MFILFLIAVSIICILVFLMFFILRGTVKKINSQTKLYFVDKLQEYDYLINEKLEHLNQINEEIKEKESRKEEGNSNNNYENYEFDYQIIDLFNKTNYQDKNIFELTKKIDSKFHIDYVSLLKRFLEQIQDDSSYRFCLNLRDKFTSDVIYQLKILDDISQKEYLNQILDDKEFQVYLLYQKLGKKPNIDGFIDYLNELVDLNNPQIFVYVGKKEENYDYLSKYIKTIYSNDIYKGIKIIFRNKIYDYSLNERNV